MKTKVDLKKWSRYETFKHYDMCTNPFIIVSVTIDITNLYNYAKKKELSIFSALGYMITKTANEFEEFRYRKKGNDIYLYDSLMPNFTENIEGKEIYYFDVEYVDDIVIFDRNFKKIRDEYYNNGEKKILINSLNEIWLSCVPWYSINSLIPPFDKENTIPQFIWDKFKKEEGRVTTNLMILIHHGFIDGYQIGTFYKKLEENIKNIKGDE